jgi:hypothetical protein
LAEKLSMSAAGSVPMTAGAIYQRAVAVLYDGQSALSITVVMVLRSLLAIVSTCRSSA